MAFHAYQSNAGWKRSSRIRFWRINVGFQRFFVLVDCLSYFMAFDRLFPLFDDWRLTFAKMAEKELTRIRNFKSEFRFIFMKKTLLILSLFFAIFSFSQKNVKDSIFVFYFKPAQAKVPKDSLIRFQKFYKKFESCQSCVFELKGFADSVGNESNNIKLSQQRIDYVKSLLTKHKKTQFKYLPLGEKLSQKSKNNQDFRKVVLRVRSGKSIPATETKNIQANNKKDTLTPEERRFVDFSKRNEAVRLNILFRLNTTDLIEESLDDVELLAKYLLENPTVNAKLLGHVCCTDDYQLSRSRALQIKVFLVRKGVNYSRLSAEGFGNTKPAVFEKGPAEEQINRRVEVIFWE